MRAVLTPDDLKAGDLADVTWHPLEMVDYDEGEASEDAKNPGSTNCIFIFKIIDGPSKGITVNKLINESPRSLGYNKALWAALGYPKDASGGYVLDSDMFRRSIGAKVMGYIKRGKSNRGNEFNDLVDFKAMS